MESLNANPWSWVRKHLGHWRQPRLNDFDLEGRALVSEAILVYTGWHERGGWPKRDPERLRERFGGDAPVLYEAVRRLEDEYYSVKPGDSDDLASAVRRATTEFRRRHADVTDEAIKALEWCYSVDWR